MLYIPITILVIAKNDQICNNRTTSMLLFPFNTYVMDNKWIHNKHVMIGILYNIIVNVIR